MSLSSKTTPETFKSKNVIRIGLKTSNRPPGVNVATVEDLSGLPATLALFI
jgi:hypothetical protein